MTLEELKAGDTVVRLHRQTRSLLTITKVTPTQLVAGNERFRRKDGSAVQKWDSFYGRPRIKPATAEDDLHFAKVDAINRLDHLLNKKRDRLMAGPLQNLIDAIKVLIREENEVPRTASDSAGV